jgi:phenylacetate-CoA ligase
MSATRIINPALEKMGREQLLKMQERRLVAQVRRCYERIPYYRELWPGEAADCTSLADVKQHVPFTTKQSLLMGQEQLADRIASPGSPVFSYHLTSGTTGMGQEVHPLTHFDQEALSSTWLYHSYWAGLEVGDRVCFTFPVGLQTGGLWSDSAAQRMAHHGIHLAPYGTENKVDYMLRFQPHGMIIAPAYLTRLSSVVVARGLDPRRAFPELKSFFIAGESYPIEWADQMIDLWGANISEWYGTMQGGLNLAFSCEHGVLRGGDRGVLHCMEHRVLCEILDPKTDEPVAPGEEGELVMTSLFREAFPVMRFRTGDRVRRVERPCSCGRPFAGIEAGTVARYDDMMKIRGQNLWPQAVDSIILASPEIEEYQGVVRYDDDGHERVDVSLEFTADSRKSAPERAAYLAEAQRRIKDELNVSMVLREVEPMSLPRYEFKVRRWDDRRREGRKVIRYTRRD